jgi:hypothetical protein
MDDMEILGFKEVPRKLASETKRRLKQRSTEIQSLAQQLGVTMLLDELRQ